MNVQLFQYYFSHVIKDSGFAKVTITGVNGKTVTVKAAVTGVGSRLLVFKYMLCLTLVVLLWLVIYRS